MPTPFPIFRQQKAQKTWFVGSENAARNRKLLTIFHRTVKSKCSIFLSCLFYRQRFLASATGNAIVNRIVHCCVGALRSSERSVTNLSAKRIFPCEAVTRDLLQGMGTDLQSPQSADPFSKFLILMGSLLDIQASKSRNKGKTDGWLGSSQTTISHEPPAFHRGPGSVRFGHGLPWARLGPLQDRKHTNLKNRTKIHQKTLKNLDF